ncbi:D-2-hydroxyacid dehydrogenase [Streptomyces sp. NPDC126514]|uniref:D-2-hydroxyacid dehydrogenase n=1 Tax=Streptomyces sp. NPDC126514 TaxID=3155210 RepID=UPI00332A1138
MHDGSITVGLAYPPAWDQRPPEHIAKDLTALHQLSPAVRVLPCRLDLPGAAADKVALSITVAVALSLPPDVTCIAPRLRWVQCLGAGVGKLPVTQLTEQGIEITTGSGVNATGVAEFALTRLLAHVKRLDDLGRQQRQRQWAPCHGAQLAGTTLGILGPGTIGTLIAERARAFGMRVLGVARHPGRPRPHIDALYPPEDLHIMLTRCDAVIAALPETPATTDWMDEQAFAAMPPGAFFCNIGRGSLVVEDALIAALRSGHLAGAALDVTREEPLPADSPLWTTPRLALSPHAAADPTAHFTGLFALLKENLSRHIRGRPLIHRYDHARGY